MRSPEVDMSAEAIDQRLRELGDLWTFWMKVRRDLPVAECEEPEPAESEVKEPKAPWKSAPPEEGQ